MLSRNKREGTFASRYNWRREQEQIQSWPNTPDTTFRWKSGERGFAFYLFRGRWHRAFMKWDRSAAAYIAELGDIDVPIVVPRGTKWHEAQAYVVARLRMEE